MTVKLIRHQEGFQRFALAIQYHGGRYLGYTSQKDESMMQSVEGRLMDAFNGEKGTWHEIIIFKLLQSLLI